MKFQPDHLDGVNTIARHDGTSIWAAGRQYTGSVIVPWTGSPSAWSAPDFDSLGPLHFHALAALGPELVIFGSGSRLRFPAPALLAGLIERRIGFETMDNAAACRTFNVLVNEGRSVIAALLLDATKR